MSGRANKKAEEEEKLLKLFQGVTKSQQDTFIQWCEQTLHTLNTANNLDGKPSTMYNGHGWKGTFLDSRLKYTPSAALPVPTFASFLKEVDSPYEVHDYVRAYLGDTPEAKDFAKQFIERRAKQNTNQHKQALPNQQQALKQQQVSDQEGAPDRRTSCVTSAQKVSLEAKSVNTHQGCGSYVSEPVK